MYRVNRTVTGASYSRSFSTFEEARNFFDAMKNISKTIEIYGNDGLIERIEK